LPKPQRYLFDRPVYSAEELKQMDPFLPPEPEWAAEWERRLAAKSHNGDSSGDEVQE
jgi:hypothetical protein